MTEHDTIADKGDTFFPQFLGARAQIDSSGEAHSFDRPSVFQAHQLEVDSREMNIKPVQQGFQPPSWFFVIFLFQLLVLGIVIPFFRNSVQLQISAVFSRSNLEQLSKNSNPALQVDSVLLFLLYALSLSTVAYTAIRIYYTQISLPDWTLYSSLLLLFAGLPLAKVMIFSLIGTVSSDRLTNKYYISNLIVYNILLGLIIFPLSFIIAYRQVNIIIIVAGVIAILFFFIRALRGVALSFPQSPLKSLYIILYLCTFEILPIILMLIISSKALIQVE